MTTSKTSVDPMSFVSINIFLLKFFGHNYISEPGWDKYWRHAPFKVLVHLMNVLTLLLPVIGESFYLIYNHDDVLELADGLHLLLTEVFHPIMAVALFWNNGLIKEMIQNLNSDMFQPTQPEHEAFFREKIKKSRTFSIFYISLTLNFIILALFKPIMEHFAVHPSNMQFPYVDIMTSPAYEIVYAMQLYYKPTQVVHHSAMVTMSSGFLSCAIVQLEMLAFNLENIDLITDRTMQGLVADKKAKNDDATRKQVRKECLRRTFIHHQKILNFVKKIENAFYIQVALQFSLSVMTICLSTLKFSSISPANDLFEFAWSCGYLFAMTMHIFTVCLFGNELTLKSDYLTTAAYNAPWINFDKDMKLSVVIFRERCKTPMFLRAAKLFDASLPTFTTLMQCSYKVYTVMNSME